MSEVQRYIVATLPGRMTRDCVEVVKARDYDALKAENARLAAALRSISKGAKRYWYEGDDAYQFAILADAALSAVPSDSPADREDVGR